MRKLYELTQEQLDTILAACRPIPYLFVGGFPPRSPQENANDAWQALGKDLNFDHMSVRPEPEKGMKFFTAEEL